jgi:nucleoside-diphosphate-sugar epimerase
MNYRGKFLWENKMPDGQKKRLLSTSRARKVLNYKSTTSISDGLDKTIEWYLNNY